MGAPETPKDQQGDGNTGSKDGRLEEFWERVRCKFRELDVAARSADEAIRQSDHRRIESLQGSLNEAFQSAEEALEELQAQIDSDRNTNPTGDV